MKELGGWRHDHYVPEGATLVVSGGFDPQAMRREIGALFGGWKKRAPGERAPIPSPAPAPGPSWIGTRMEDAGQVTLYEATIDVNPEDRSAWSRAWGGISGFLHDPIVASVIAAIVGAALLTLGPKAYRNARARYGRRPSAGPEAGASVPPPPE